MGAGKIANRWIRGARQLEDMDIVAVASELLTAQNAAKQYRIPEALAYETLIKRETLMLFTFPASSCPQRTSDLAMKHGKSVLVEKPVAINSHELQEMLDCARKNKVFFMEAVWTRFFPMVERIKQLIGEDGIGDVER